MDSEINKMRQQKITTVMLALPCEDTLGAIQSTVLLRMHSIDAVVRSKRLAVADSSREADYSR